jgi:hypothetical protein
VTLAEHKAAPPVIEAPEKVMVRAVSGRLITRISSDAANELVTAGKADPVGRTRLRYIRLHADVHLERGPRGWWLVEETLKRRALVEAR